MNRVHVWKSACWGPNGIIEIRSRTLGVVSAMLRADRQDLNIELFLIFNEPFRHEVRLGSLQCLSSLEVVSAQLCEWPAWSSSCFVTRNKACVSWNDHWLLVRLGFLLHVAVRGSELVLCSPVAWCSDLTSWHWSVLVCRSVVELGDFLVEPGHFVL